MSHLTRFRPFLLFFLYSLSLLFPPAVAQSSSLQFTTSSFRVIFNSLSLSNYSSVSAPFNFNSTLRSELASLGGGSTWSSTWFSVDSVSASLDSAFPRGALMVEVRLALSSAIFTADYVYTQSSLACCSRSCSSFGYCQSPNPTFNSYVVLSRASAFQARCCDGQYLYNNDQCNKCQAAHIDYLPILLGCLLGSLAFVLIWVGYRKFIERNRNKAALKPSTIHPRLAAMQAAQHKPTNEGQTAAEAHSDGRHSLKGSKAHRGSVQHPINAKPGNLHHQPDKPIVHRNSSVQAAAFYPTVPVEGQPSLPPGYEGQIQFVQPVEIVENGRRTGQYHYVPLSFPMAPGSNAPAPVQRPADHRASLSQARQVHVTQVVHHPHSQSLSHSHHHSSHHQPHSASHGHSQPRAGPAPSRPADNGPPPLMRLPSVSDDVYFIPAG